LRFFKGFLVFNILLICLMPQTSHPCTTFCLDHGAQKLFGKNYDWHIGRGLVIINKRGVLKTAIADREKDPGPYAHWTSRYGSLTFNQYGRENPMGGMNEAGLVIHMMMLPETQYPEPDSRLVIGSLQWIQYQLDNFSKVEEVISSDHQIRIIPKEEPGLHYLVMDRMGNCASIEFLDGKLVYHTRETMPVKTLANSTYAFSVEYLKWHQGFDGRLLIPNGESSLVRFVKAANMLKSDNLKAKKQKSLVDYAFDILANVAQTSTKWSIVYDLQNLRSYFRTSSNQQIRYVDLKAFDFSCLQPVKVLDMDTDFSGNISNEFYDYTPQYNLDLIRHAFKETYFLNNVPDPVLEILSRYPESTSCTE
jgi:penicillin V acylase-like amidase (Ntn superfamily)